MNKFQNLSLFLLRISMGWLFFYAGMTKIINPEWSAAGYLENAKTFTWLYQWFAAPGILSITNFLNEWGLVLIGAALLLGVSVRLASIAGAVLMILYYFPGLEFPHVGRTAYIVDEHVIYALALLLLGTLNAGRTWGLGDWWSRTNLVRKYPWLS